MRRLVITRARLLANYFTAFTGRVIHRVDRSSGEATWRVAKDGVSLVQVSFCSRCGNKYRFTKEHTTRLLMRPQATDYGARYRKCAKCFGEEG